MCKPITTENLEKRQVSEPKTITVTPRWIVDWLIRIAILLATSFAGLAWGQAKGIARGQDENTAMLSQVNNRLEAVETKVGEGPTDRIDALEVRMTATEQSRFTDDEGLEVWRELDSKVDRRELADVEARLDNRFNRLDDKLDRLIMVTENGGP